LFLRFCFDISRRKYLLKRFKVFGTSPKKFCDTLTGQVYIDKEYLSTTSYAPYWHETTHIWCKFCKYVPRTIIFCRSVLDRAEQVYPMSFVLQCQPLNQRYLLVHHHSTGANATAQPRPELGLRFEKQAHSQTDVWSLIVLFHFKASSLEVYNACKREEMRGTNESDALHGKRH